MFTYMLVNFDVLHFFMKIWVFLWFCFSSAWRTSLAFLIEQVCWQWMTLDFLQFFHQYFTHVISLFFWSRLFLLCYITERLHNVSSLKIYLFFCLICSVSFSSRCLQDTLFTFSFQQFACDVPRYYFSYLYCLWFLDIYNP